MCVFQSRLKPDANLQSFSVADRNTEDVERRVGLSTPRHPVSSAIWQETPNPTEGRLSLVSPRTPVPDSWVPPTPTFPLENLPSYVGSRSFDSGPGTSSRVSGVRNEDGRSHHQPPADGYQAGYESSSDEGQFIGVRMYSDPNPPTNGRSRRVRVHNPGPQSGQPFVPDPDHVYDLRTKYDHHGGPGYDAPSRSRERHDRGGGRRRGYKFTAPHQYPVIPAEDNDEEHFKSTGPKKLPGFKLGSLFRSSSSKDIEGGSHRFNFLK